MKSFQKILVLAAVAAAAGPSATQVAAQILSSTGQFTRYTGDVTTPPQIATFETFVNGLQVFPDSPENLSGNGILQGSLDLPPGTSSVEFKNRQVGLEFNPSSLIAFQGVVDDPIPGSHDTPFKFGILTVQNGVFFNQASFDLTIETSSSDPFFDNRAFTDSIQYVVTPNSGDPVANANANADYIEFSNHPELGQVRVYETASTLGNIGTVELWGKVGSSDPLYFANPQGGVFLQAVPEPHRFTLIFGGVLAVGACLRKLRA